MKGGLEPFFVAYVLNSLVLKVHVVRGWTLVIHSIVFKRSTRAFHNCVLTEFFVIKVRVLRVRIDYS